MARRRVSKSQIIWFAHVLRDARPRPQHRDQTFGFLQVPRFFPVLDKHKPQEIAAWRKPSDGSVIMRASPWPYRTVCEHPHRCASSRKSARPAALPGSVTPGSCLEISACLGDGRRSFTENVAPAGCMHRFRTPLQLRGPCRIKSLMPAAH